MKHQETNYSVGATWYHRRDDRTVEVETGAAPGIANDFVTVRNTATGKRTKLRVSTLDREYTPLSQG